MRFGIFGVGRVGRVHIQILLSQGQTVACVGDENNDAIRSALTALELSATLPTFSSAAAMAASGLIDAVVIGSHAKNHENDARPFVDAKLPIYLEKPLTADLGAAFDFVATLGTDRRVMQIGLQRRYDDALLYAKSLLDRECIGKVCHIRSVLRDQYPPPSTYVSPGLIIDMAVHVADEAIWLCGEFPSVVSAQQFVGKCASMTPTSEHFNTASISLETPSGVICQLDISRTHSAGYNNETYIIGTTGIIHVGRFCGYPGPIPVEVWKNDGQMLVHESKVFCMAGKDNDCGAEFLPRFRSSFANAHVAFRDAVVNNQPFAVTQLEVLDAQVVVTAAYVSACRGGQRIHVARSDDIVSYRQHCVDCGILKQ